MNTDAGKGASKSILVVSYYRSGTSALSGTMSLAGVEMVNTDERNEHNPRGFFENPDLARIDMEIFERINRQWHDIRMMPKQWSERPDMLDFGQRIFTEIKKQYGASSLWAIKHPHLCRLFPLYADAARRVSGSAPGVIHIYRDPWVVARSQARKNGMTRCHSLLLWASYVLEAERATRGLDRVILDYETLLKDAHHVLDRISRGLGFEYPKRTTADRALINQFLTPQLRRSQPQQRETTPAVVREFIEDVWAAALDDADPERFDRLHERFFDLSTIIEEMSSSGLSPVPIRGSDKALSPSLRPIPGAGTEHQGASGEGQEQVAKGSRLRPEDRTDLAAYRNLDQALKQCGTRQPTVTIFVAVPAGRVQAALETERSIREQWFAPQETRFVCADADAPEREGWHRIPGADDRPGAVIHAIAEQIADVTTDYVAIIDAGDRIEPDACGRMTVFADQRKRPEIIYTDEIVARTQNPWVRFKPEFDIERERNLHYLGGWMWIDAVVVKHLPIDPELFGAEDYDLVLRAFDTGMSILRLPEALYARAVDSRRDRIDAATLVDHARAALGAHLERAGLSESVDVQNGPVPGTFVTRYRPCAGHGISLVLSVDGAQQQHLPELDPARLARTVEALGIESLVVLCSHPVTADSPLDRAMHAISTRDPLPGRIHVIRAEHEAQGLKAVRECVGDGAVVFLAIEASTSDAHWIAHLQGRLYAANDTGIVGAAASYHSTPGGSDSMLIGPLLLGGADGVGMVGLGHSAEDPGPGGWLMTAQQADGVLPPCVAFRGDLIKRVDIDDQLSGPQLWLDLAMRIRAMGYAVVWDPAVRFTCPSVTREVEHLSSGQAKDGNRRIRARWGCRSRQHHPMLALSGDVLTEAGNIGLCAPSPATTESGRYTLLSGPLDGAEFAAECLRVGRMQGAFEAGWVSEPVPATELLRLRPDHWLRVNPDRAPNDTDLPDWSAIFTRPPADLAPLGTIGAQARRVFATSPTLADQLAKRSHGKMRAELIVPRLPGRIWKDFAADGAVGRHLLRLLWVDEGNPPDWITDLLGLSSVQWFVIENGERHYDGRIATYMRPSDEADWCSLLRSIAPHAVIRPARDAVWMDCQILLRAAAAGAALYADPRLHVPDGMPVTAVLSRFDDWRKAVERMSQDVEALDAAGKAARSAVERLGWIEDFDVLPLLAPPRDEGRCVQNEAKAV